MNVERVLKRTIFFLATVLVAWPALVAFADALLEAGPPAAKTPAQADRPIAFVNAKIHPVSSAPIARGTLVVQRGKIVAVGPADSTPIPAGAEVRDVAGKVIIPGLVDTHSHVGIFPRPRSPAHQDGNEMTGPVQPGLRAIDAIHPHDPGFKMALAGGVTTANIMPGSGNAIGGATLYVKFRGAIVEAMRILTERILGGIKFANGENPKGVYGAKGAAPGTRMKIAALQREQLVRAQEYRRKLQQYEVAKKSDPKATRPDRDLALEPLVEALDKRRTVHFHCHRADDIMTAVRLADEFGLEIVLQHCTEGYRVADELAKRGIWVSLTLLDSPGGKPEAMGLLEENAAILTKAGVKVAINTDDFVTDSRFFLRSGAIAVRGGLSEDDALKALTLHGAEMMHLEDRLGSLRPGLDADFVVLSGAPFSVYTQVLETWIDGEKVFDRTTSDGAYQTGGFAVADARLVPGPIAPMSAPALAKLPELPPGAKAYDGGKAYVVLAGKLHTVAGATIDDGVVLVENGLVKQIGRRDQFAFPAGVPVLRAAHVTPGLIDAFSVVGLSGATNNRKADQDQDELSDPNQADLRVLDSLNPNEPLLQFIREQGVTVIHATPGPANVLAGQTGVFRTVGNTVDRMKIRFPAAQLVNLGEEPKSTYSGKFPSTRMGLANLVRTQLTLAKGYAEKKASAKEPPPANLKFEALAPTLDKSLPVFFAAQRSSDLLTALRISDEFGLRPVLTMAADGYLVGEHLAKAGVPVVVHPTMQRPGTMETFNTHLGNAAALADRKLTVAIGTGFEGYVPKTRVLRFEAAMAMANGLGFDRALASITREPGKILGIAESHGTLEPGKVADLVLYDGDPFEHATHVTHTIVGGRLVHDRAEYLKLPIERRALSITGGVGSDFGCCLGW